MLTCKFPLLQVLQFEDGKIHRDVLSTHVYALRDTDPEKYQKLFPEPEQLIPMMYQWLHLYYRTVEKMPWVKEAYYNPELIDVIIAHESEDELISIGNAEQRFDSLEPLYWRLAIHQ